jgi:hypothetical protein
MQIECPMVSKFEFLTSNIEAMTTAYRYLFCNWFILKDKLNYAMVIAFIDKAWIGVTGLPYMRKFTQ